MHRQANFQIGFLTSGEKWLLKIEWLNESFRTREGLVHLLEDEFWLDDAINNLLFPSQENQSNLPRVNNIRNPRRILQVIMIVSCSAVHCFTSRMEKWRGDWIWLLSFPPMVNNRTEMSVYSIVISRHLLLLYKCPCHILTLVIWSIVTTSVNVVFLALCLSSCRRTELNCGNKENEKERKGERETILFIHSFLALSLSLSLSAVFNTRGERGKRWA